MGSPQVGADAAGSPTQPSAGRQLVLVLGALGVVYGDIGTSPLYALRECFNGPHAIALTPANVLGVLSLILWSLTLVVTVKYLVVVMRADNRGEGGILALMALVLRARDRRQPPTSVKDGVRRAGKWNGWSTRAITALGLFGAALLYGDGLITPAISVMSAVEGLEVAAPALGHYVVPISVLILVGLFALQRRGTSGMGRLFGPVMLVWFTVLAVLGIRGLWHHPQVLWALDPRQALAFLLHNRLHGLLVLGAVFLAVTGAEALYADMGHFGRRPIRRAWALLVLPALLLNYFGQGALLLAHPEATPNPFFNLGPRWSVIPMIGLATLAAVIASQALISGAFSLTRQAVQLGYLPRMQIVHTSSESIGQIYVPALNWVLCAGVIALCVGFRRSSALASAYGVAVTLTMTITTLLSYVVARELWQWPRWAALTLFGTFLVVDLTFFVGNAGKLAGGGWLPLGLAAGVFTLMTTWKTGREVLANRLCENQMPLKMFFEELQATPPPRAPGTAIFLTSVRGVTPPALLHNLEHNNVLHQRVVLMTLQNQEIPTVPRAEKVRTADLPAGFHEIEARFGFMETPSLRVILELCAERGLTFKASETTYFLGREVLLATERPGMALWRERLFGWMSRNARSAVAFFGIPSDRVVEIGLHVEL